MFEKRTHMFRHYKAKHDPAVYQQGTWRPASTKKVGNQLTRAARRSGGPTEGEAEQGQEQHGTRKVPTYSCRALFVCRVCRVCLTAVAGLKIWHHAMGGEEGEAGGQARSSHGPLPR
jgi:hypothetical protein